MIGFRLSTMARQMSQVRAGSWRCQRAHVQRRACQRVVSARARQLSLFSYASMARPVVRVPCPVRARMSQRQTPALMLTGGTRPHEWSMLIVNRTNESQIFCSWCHVAFRGWRNDLLGHIRSKTHLKKANGGMNRFLASEPPAKRTATEVTIAAKDLFLSRAYLHAEACGISYTAMFNLL